MIICVMRHHLRVLIVIATVLALSCASLAAAWVLLPPLLAGPATASLHVEPHLNGRHLTIVATSDLADGTTFDWEVWNEAEADTNDLVQLARAHDAHAQATLTGGRFEASADLTGWPAGRTAVRAAFYPGSDQPAGTIAKVGEVGEHLTGPGVEDCSGTPCLVAYLVIDLPSQ